MNLTKIIFPLKPLLHTFVLLIVLAIIPGLNSSVYGQEPSYTLIGEDRLAGVDVYSIIQDDKENIWLSTNEGILRYDGYEFKSLKNSEILNQSLFGLTKNDSNQLFCFNLSGQILRIKNDSLDIYFQIPDSLISDNYSIAINQSNELVIACRRSFRLTQNKEIIFLEDQLKTSSSNTSVIATENGEILLSSTGNNPITHYKNNTLFRSYKVRSSASESITLVFQNNHCVLFENSPFSLYHFADSSFIKVPLQYSIKDTTLGHNIYITKDEKIWISLRTEGMLVFDKYGNPMYDGKAIFKNHYISCKLEDREGNYWFPTLGNGIIFFKKPDMLSYAFDEKLKDEKLLSIAFNQSTGKLYAGSKSGKIYQIWNEHSKGEPTFIHQNIGMGVELLYNFNNQIITVDFSNLYFIVNSNNKLKITPKTLPGSTVKDVFFINSDHAVIASRTNALKLTKDTSLLLFTGRTNCARYDSITDSYWIGTPKGLYQIKNGSIRENLFKNKRVIATCFTGAKDAIWAATSSQGVLKITGDSISPFLNMTNGLLSERVKKVRYYNDRLYISHGLGIQVYSIKTGSLKTINSLAGLYSDNVTDFDVYQNQLAVVNHKGLQVLNLDKIQLNSHPPAIVFHSIQVNNAKVSVSQSGVYKHSQNKVRFEFRAQAYSHQGTLRYYYKLGGFSEDWQQASSDQNFVLYNALPSGDYTFLVKAINESGTESKTLKYTFTIAKPVWAEWWFLGLSALAFLGLVYAIYRYQINRIRKMNRQRNELISSKLTAIQSQMNPHFIFNALNSIQDLVLKEDIDNSYNYIVKFSNLLRRTLNYSDKDFIDFENEVKLIELYLQLEKLRFKTNFEFTIDTHEIEGISVPPMIVQPFIENALKHGLLHKGTQEMKRITVEFELSEILICTVIDNGIGRDRAREIKERQSTHHESFSVKAIRNRFEILKEHFKLDLGLEYEDLFENGEPCGTKVVLRLPFRRHF